MFGFMPRPKSKNELVKRLISVQCRTLGNEHDATLQRDLAYAEKEAEAAADLQLLKLMLEMSALCMHGCDLERYADRKNPAIFVYNLMSMPRRRARQSFSRVEELRDKELLASVSAEQSRCRLSMTVQVNVDLDLLDENPVCRSALELAARQMYADTCGNNIQPEHVEVFMWGWGYIDGIISPPEEVDPSQVLQLLRSAKPATLTQKLAVASEADLGAAVSGGRLCVSDIQMTPHLSSSRSEAIFKVCYHSAWLEQNSREWDSAQGGAITGTSAGFLKHVAEDEGILKRYIPWMGFDS